MFSFSNFTIEGHVIACYRRAFYRQKWITRFSGQNFARCSPRKETGIRGAKDVSSEHGLGTKDDQQDRFFLCYSFEEHERCLLTTKVFMHLRWEGTDVFFRLLFEGRT